MPCEYPIFLDLTGRLAVVVGGGTVAARRIEKLLAAGADLRVVATEISDTIASLAESALPSQKRRGAPKRKPTIELFEEPFMPAHLDGAFLVLACTDEPRVNAQVAAAAREAGVLVNSADDPANCDFFMPAVSEHGPVKIAISTGGSAPALARFVRELLDTSLPPELPTLAEELARLRPRLRRLIPSGTARAAVWRQVCSDDSIRRLREDGVAGWRAWARSLIES